MFASSKDIEQRAGKYVTERGIELTIVQPPFLLDFAGAWLDESPDFPSEVIELWMVEKQQEFCEHWPEVAAILDNLAQRF